jgi:hypothetical protein
MAAVIAAARRKLRIPLPFLPDPMFAVRMEDARHGQPVYPPRARIDGQKARVAAAFPRNVSATRSSAALGPRRRAMYRLIAGVCRSNSAPKHSGARSERVTGEGRA